jgi:hypothetical protein
MIRGYSTTPFFAAAFFAVGAQAAPDFAGHWTLNNALTVAPREIGFSVDWATPTGPGMPPGSNESSGGGGRRGGRSGGGGGGSSRGGAQPFPTHAESEADAKRVQQLTAEVREPSTHLTIVDTPTAITITTDRGQTRTLHPDGRDEVVPLDGVDVSVNTKRDAGRLIVLYEVEEGRQLRYTYSRGASPAQLMVDVQFVGRGGGDEVKRVYEPTKPNEPVPTPSQTSSASSYSSSATGPGQQQQPFDQQPGAELKGLTKLGLVVEQLSAQAIACGLNQSTLESSVTTHLTAAGLKVARNSDEDTYLYVNVMTASLSNGYCVSRYDVSLNTHTTATLSYGHGPVLVEVSLLHKGAIAGGAPAANADGVTRGLLDFVDQFTARIREVNKP